MFFDRVEFSNRQQQLLDNMLPNSICVLAAATLQTRSRDTEYPFRQDSYFNYMCGFPEPQAWWVLSNHADYPQGLSVLFCLDKDPHAEIWHGRRIGPKQAKKQFQATMTFALEDLEDKLLELLDGHQHLYFAQGHNTEVDQFIFSLLAELRSAPKQSQTAPASIVDVRVLLDEMRLIKSEQEINLMQQAATISAQAHIKAMQFAEPGKNEYHLEAQLHHEFDMQGAKHPA